MTSGSVVLVGAGPGDPELLTAAALSALDEADVVFADRLVPATILERVRAEVRVARKFKGRAEAAQDELHRWMLAAARQGRRVVRLKCGDPFVFGRGSEEIAFLESHGVPVRVLPGVSSALYAPAAVGIPVTARGVADRVTVLTGHGAAGRPVELPRFDRGATLVWLMAMSRLDGIAAQLIGSGFPADWPTAIVASAGHPDQRAARMPLATAASTARDLALRAPAAVIMGNVVRLAHSAAFEADMLAAEIARVA